MPGVDAIVLDLDGGAMLAACVASLRAQTMPFARIIVFDNGSRTPTANIDGVELHRSDKNLGFAGGMNAAFRFVRAEFVALINNDVVLDPDWLATVMTAMEPDVAAAQTIIRRDDTTIDGAGIDISDGTFRQLGHGLPLGTPLPDAWGVSATAAVYRVHALAKQLFDELLFAYYEDVELSARLARDWRLRVVHEAKATHHGSQTSNRVNAKYLRTRNRYRVARKHRGIGSIRALLWEDVKRRGSLRGIIAGLLG